MTLRFHSRKLRLVTFQVVRKNVVSISLFCMYMHVRASEYIQICLLRYVICVCLCVRIFEIKTEREKEHNRLRIFAFDRTSLHQLPHMVDMGVEKGMRNTQPSFVCVLPLLLLLTI